MIKIEDFLKGLTQEEWEYLIKKVYSYVAKRRKGSSSTEMSKLAKKRWNKTKEVEENI